MLVAVSRQAKTELLGIPQFAATLVEGDTTLGLGIEASRRDAILARLIRCTTWLRSATSRSTASSHRVNVIGTRNMIAFARRRSPVSLRFHHVSTRHVSGTFGRVQGDGADRGPDEPEPLLVDQVQIRRTCWRAACPSPMYRPGIVWGDSKTRPETAKFDGLRTVMGAVEESPSSSSTPRGRRSERRPPSTTAISGTLAALRLSPLGPPPDPTTSPAAAATLRVAFIPPRLMAKALEAFGHLFVPLPATTTARPPSRCHCRGPKCSASFPRIDRTSLRPALPVFDASRA